MSASLAARHCGSGTCRALHGPLLTLRHHGACEAVCACHTGWCGGDGHPLSRADVLVGCAPLWGIVALRVHGAAASSWAVCPSLPCAVPSKVLASGSSHLCPRTVQVSVAKGIRYLCSSLRAGVRRLLLPTAVHNLLPLASSSMLPESQLPFPAACGVSPACKVQAAPPQSTVNDDAWCARKATDDTGIHRWQGLQRSGA